MNRFITAGVVSLFLGLIGAAVVAHVVTKEPVAMKQHIPTCAEHYALSAALFPADPEGLRFCQETAMRSAETPGTCRAVYTDGLLFDMCERTAAELRHAGEPDYSPSCASIYADDSSRRTACERVEETLRGR